MAPVYLDNNATTRVDPAVLAAMIPYFTEHFGNPSSLHEAGTVAARAVGAARQQVQALLGAASEREVLFTSGATESNHTAVCAALEARPRRDELVVSAVEHQAVLGTCARLAHAGRVRVRVVPVDGAGRLDVAAFRRALNERTALASVMWANNETGTVFDVEQLARCAHEAGALFHTDAVQAVGRVPIALAASEVDLLSLSAHKLHGPKGVGALYVRSGLRLAPLFRGGKQEHGRRAGTENVPGVVGLGRSAELALANLGLEDTQVRELRDRLERGVLTLVPGVTVQGDPERRLGNTSCFTFEAVDGEALVAALDAVGIAASSGAACASGMTEPSHVLRAMQVSPTLALGALRLSLSRDTTRAEVERVLEVLPRLVDALRRDAAGERGAGLDEGSVTA
jgi:cysteine desulfurase